MFKSIRTILILSMFLGWLPKSAMAAECEGTLYPLTIRQSILDSATPGDAIDILDGSSPSDHGWLIWNPSRDDENYLVFEITDPKKSLQDYIDPAQGSDTILNRGDYVTSLSGTHNSSNLKTELEGLVGQEFLVPVWDDTHPNGFKSFPNPVGPPPTVNAYLISGFARVVIEQVSDIQIAPNKIITATYLGAGPNTIHCPALSLTKSGPAAATPGAVITYTLHLTNSGNLSATNLTLTDTLPLNANYVDGGSNMGGVVSWTIATLDFLSGSNNLSRTFRVTATQTITNNTFAVTANDTISTTGSNIVVTTIITPPLRLYLPLIIKING